MTGTVKQLFICKSGKSGIAWVRLNNIHLILYGGENNSLDFTVFVSGRNLHAENMWGKSTWKSFDEIVFSWNLQGKPNQSVLSWTRLKTSTMCLCMLWRWHGCQIINGFNIDCLKRPLLWRQIPSVYGFGTATENVSGRKFLWWKSCVRS